MQESTVMPFAQMKLKRMVEIEHMKEGLKSYAVKLFHLMVQGGECLREYQVLVVEKTNIEVKTVSLMIQAECH